MGLRPVHGQARAIGLIHLRPLEPSDVDELLALRLANRDFLTQFEPRRAGSFFTRAEQLRHIAVEREDRRVDRRHVFGIFLDDPGGGEAAMVGRIALDNIVRGAWQNATLGYFVDKDHNDRGIATVAVAKVVRFAFTEERLHRVQAGVMPRNVASIRVLEKCGFKEEGFAPRYLQINGRWEDHNLYAVTIEDWEDLQASRS